MSIHTHDTKEKRKNNMNKHGFFLPIASLFASVLPSVLLVATLGAIAMPAEAASKKKALIQCGQFTESPIVNGNLIDNLTAFYGSPGMPPVLAEDMDQAFHVWFDQGQRLASGCTPAQSVYTVNDGQPGYTAINQYDANRRLRSQQLRQNNVPVGTLTFKYNAAGQLVDSQGICDNTFQNLSGVYNYTFAYNSNGTLARVTRTPSAACTAGSAGFMNFTYGDAQRPGMPTRIQTASSNTTVAYAVTGGKVTQVKLGGDQEATLILGYQGTQVQRLTVNTPFSSRFDEFTYNQSNQLLTDSNGVFDVLFAIYVNTNVLERINVNTGTLRWAVEFGAGKGRAKQARK
jgi:hypothetical protein